MPSTTAEFGSALRLLVVLNNILKRAPIYRESAFYARRVAPRVSKAKQ